MHGFGGKNKAPFFAVIRVISVVQAMHDMPTIGSFPDGLAILTIAISTKYTCFFKI